MSDGQVFAESGLRTEDFYGDSLSICNVKTEICWVCDNFLAHACTILQFLSFFCGLDVVRTVQNKQPHSYGPQKNGV